MLTQFTPFAAPSKRGEKKSYDPITYPGIWWVSFAIAFVYTVIYAYALLTMRVNIDKPGGESWAWRKLLVGFCVTIPAPEGYSGPMRYDNSDVIPTVGCSENQFNNSHVYAGSVDAIIVILILIQILIDWKKGSIKKLGLSFYITIFLSVFLHGGFHWFFALGSKCFMPESAILQENNGAIGLSIFLFVFSFLIAFGALSVGPWSPKNTAIVSAVLGIVILATELLGGGSWGLAGLFLVTHLVKAIVVLKRWDQTSGNSFVLSVVFLFATLAAFCELTICDNIWKAVGGHVWYDLSINGYAALTLYYSRMEKADQKERRD